MSAELDITEFDEFLSALRTCLDDELFGDVSDEDSAAALQAIKRFASFHPNVAQMVFNRANDLYNGTGNL